MSVPTKEQYLKAIADELHKPVRKVKNFRTVRADFKDQVWSMDLVDMSEWKDENDGNKFLLTVVDVFTRFAWARPMKSKSAIDTFAAFISIVEESKRQPKKIWVDQGSEFYNSVFKKWMKAHSVEMYSTFGNSKSVIVERFNRTLKTKMWYYFTKDNTRRWVDNLPLLLKWYNTKVHSKLDMSPWEASKRKNQSRIELIQNPDKDTSGVKRKPKYEVGQSVRISRIKGVFEKGYIPNWSRETFTIIEVQVPYDFNEPIVYKLKDRQGEEIRGSFYQEELQPVKYPDVLLVEKVLKTKKIGGKEHHLVKWLGYSEKMNSWIPKSDILDFLGKPKFEVTEMTENKIKLKRIS